MSAGWHAELLEAITAAQAMFVGVVRPAPLFEGLLRSIIQLTGSELGFFSEVLRREDGRPYLKVYVFAGDEGRDARLELGDLETVFASLLKSGDSLVANSSIDLERLNLTSTRAPLHAFAGLPLRNVGSLIGMIGLANRAGGYQPELLERLEPLLLTAANALFATRSDRQRRQAEEQLRSEEARIRAMLAGVQDGIITIDSRGVIESVNPGAERMFGYSANELLGERVSLLIPESLRAKGEDLLSLFLERGSPAVVGFGHEMQVCKKSGEQFLASLRTTEIWGPEKKLYTGIFRDLSEREEAKREVDRLQKELTQSRFGQMIGSSAPMRELYEGITEVAAGDWNVLIEGETGVGKELVARALHAGSVRRDRPFLASNLPGVTDSLIGSHLFGHRRGSFTGAHRDQQGLFESADGGTLFLDEIADISDSLQAALLRVIEEGEIVRIGESAPRKVDVRLLAATNKSLSEAVAEGRFRADLFYRLRVGRITVPPLRERRADIPLLAEAFLAKARVASGKTITRFSPGAIRRLVDYSWPGNAREVRNGVEYAVIRCRASTIDEDHLPPEVLSGQPVQAGKPVASQAQRQYILDVLARTGGNRTAAARELGMSRATFYRRLSSLGI